MGVCPNLARWVQSLQDSLKMEKLPEEKEVFNVAQQIWEKVFKYGVSLFLTKEDTEFHLMVDYSTKDGGMRCLQVHIKRVG